MTMDVPLKANYFELIDRPMHRLYAKQIGLKGQRMDQILTVHLTQPVSETITLCGYRNQHNWSIAEWQFPEIFNLNNR